LKKEGNVHITNEKIIILGLGNPLRRDDGIGVAVVEALKEYHALPEDITIIDAGTSNVDLLLLMQGYQRAYIIDAAEFGGDPGEWRCIPIQDISFDMEVQTRYESYHHANLKDAISLGQALGILPKQIFIYAVQPQDLQISIGLSEPTSVAAQEITEDLLHRFRGD